MNSLDQQLKVLSKGLGNEDFSALPMVTSATRGGLNQGPFIQVNDLSTQPWQLFKKIIRSISNIFKNFSPLKLEIKAF